MNNNQLSPRRILVVDDEPNIRLLCQRFLTGEGFEVDIVSDGKSALDMLGQRKYDLMLCDIKMPIMDGRELYESLHQSYQDMLTKVIFITGSAQGSDTQNFLKKSGRPVVSKPFTIEELEEVIRRTLDTIT